MFFRTFILLFALPIVAQADVDFSNYDVPLYTQIVDRIKAKVSARLGEAVTRASGISSFLLLTKIAVTTRNFRTRLSPSFESLPIISSPS
jgi:hypothetical protein